MSKTVLLEKIVARLQHEVEALKQAALATHAEATDDENKAEDKYDTRGLEASYLAHGQSKAAEEAALAVAQFRALPVKTFAATEPVSLGALVTFTTGRQTAYYFIGPRAGGTEIEHESRTIMVITPQSPLGRQLVGRRLGENIALEYGGRRSVGLVSAVE